MKVSGVDFDKLTDEQKHFATADFDKPCFSNAVAGSGKTTSCVARIQKMLESGIKAEDILLLSFTNAAANSIVERVESVLGAEVVKGITAGTFHHVFNNVLRKYYKRVGLDPHYTIQTEEIHNEAMKLIFEEVEFPKGKGCPTSRNVLFLVSQMKLRSLLLEDAIEIFMPHFDMFSLNIADAVNEYFDYCDEKHILDYNDLLIKTLELLENNPDICKKLNETYKYIIVDEYQDTNKIEARILELLRQDENKGLTVVGDTNQSIFSFINSDVNNILSFKNNNPTSNEASLTTNFRSNQEILDVANEIVRDTQVGDFYEMVGTHSSGRKPIIAKFRNMYDEASATFDTIRFLHEKLGLTLNEICVIIRNGSQSIPLELEIQARRPQFPIDFIKRGGKKFLDSKEAQDVIHFLEVIDETDLELSWIRTLNHFEKIGQKTAEQITKLILTEDGVNIDNLISDDLKKKSYYNSILKFKTIFDRSHVFQKTEQKVKYIIDNYKDLRETVIMKSQAKTMTEDLDRLDKSYMQLKNLVDFASEYTSLRDFLDALVLDDKLKKDKNEDNSDYLTISTIHSAKGLEWKAVIFIGVVDEVLPGESRIYSDRPEAEEIANIEKEEGRRLCYVAVTRAKDYLFIYHPQRDMNNFGLHLSRFIDKISVLDCIDEISSYNLSQSLTSLLGGQDAK